MTRRRSYRLTVALIAAGIALTGCAEAEGADPELSDVATVAEAEDGGPGIITLSEPAERRLGITTTAVATGPAGLVVPYAALIYDTDGATSVFARLEPLTYQRMAVTVSGRSGDRVELTSGPPSGTDVVTVGAPELVGIETGIDGEE